MKRVFNYSAGPGTLPLEVLEASAAALVDYQGKGFGIAECSHRGKEFDGVIDEAIALAHRLLGIGDIHDVLFLQGGATQMFHVMEEERNRLVVRLYGALGDVDWIRYGAPDPWLREIRWLQAAGDEVTITVDLAGGLWGYRARWQGNDLVLDLRRPPRIDRDHPLAGRRIVVDPGHPPAGARGPTGLSEAEANLAIAIVLRELLVAEGAEVIMTRDGDLAMDLNPRTRQADSVDAELLVSIHNNALPDGVNPFTNNGSSVFYNHPRSEPLARAIQEAFIRELPVRGLGAARGDLALVRPTWMPAVLTEGLFMMLPRLAGRAPVPTLVRDLRRHAAHGPRPDRGPGQRARCRRKASSSSARRGAVSWPTRRPIRSIATDRTCSA